MTELEAAYAEHTQALASVKRHCEGRGQYMPLAVFSDPAVKAANERITRAINAMLEDASDG